MSMCLPLHGLKGLTALLVAPMVALGWGVLEAGTPRFPVPAPPADLAAPPQATTTHSGLATLQVQPGTAPGHPAADDLVTADYVIWTQDGKVLDTTATWDKPLIRPMGRLLKGMREALQLMTPGEVRRAWVPMALAFAGAPNRPQGPLVMELRLHAFEPSPFKAPADLLGPGDGAQVLPSGLALRVLRQGQGGQHPRPGFWVSVQYTGWTQDGKVFDSTWRNSGPATLRLGEVIRGWTEGLQLMEPGGKVRLWVPEKLAYRGQDGMPKGTLVFDIELMETGE